MLLKLLNAGSVTDNYKTNVIDSIDLTVSEHYPPWATNDEVDPEMVFFFFNYLPIISLVKFWSRPNKINKMRPMASLNL